MQQGRLDGDSEKAVLKVEGPIVSEWVPVLEAECQRLLETNKELILDFSSVTYIDSRGVKALQGLSLEIINCTRLIEETLESCGGCGSSRAQ